MNCVVLSRAERKREKTIATNFALDISPSQLILYTRPPYLRPVPYRVVATADGDET